MSHRSLIGLGIFPYLWFKHFSRLNFANHIFIPLWTRFSVFLLSPPRAEVWSGIDGIILLLTERPWGSATFLMFLPWFPALASSPTMPCELQRRLSRCLVPYNPYRSIQSLWYKAFFYGLSRWLRSFFELWVPDLCTILLSLVNVIFVKSLLKKHRACCNLLKAECSQGNPVSPNPFKVSDLLADRVHFGGCQKS